MLSQFDIGWLVGLIEGDGTFTSDGPTAVVGLKITDHDTALRFAALLKTTVSGPYHYPDQQLGPKPYYMSKITGRRAREFMRSTAHHYSLRRQQQIRDICGDQPSLGIAAHTSAEAA